MRRNDAEWAYSAHRVKTSRVAAEPYTRESRDRDRRSGFARFQFCDGTHRSVSRIDRNNYMASAGYSGKTVAQKIGIKAGSAIRTHNVPANYRKILGPLPDDVVLSDRMKPPVDLVHAFVTSRKQLETQLRSSLSAIRQDGAIWVSWPKKSSGVRTDVTEDVIRAVALPLGLVDVKVCAVDETWSGLKLVIRVKNRR